MYAESYGNLFQAKLTIDGLPENYGLRACRDCSSCSAFCPNGIKIQARVKSLVANGFC